MCIGCVWAVAICRPAAVREISASSTCSNFAEDKDGKMRATGGDSYVATIEFGPTVRARSLISYGNASQPGSPHAGDQLELFAKKQLKDVWLTRADIEKNLELRETIRR